MIEHLIVVAAPSAAGKTILRKEMRAQQFSEFRARLGIRDLREWQCVSRKSIKQSKTQELKEFVIFECNITPGYHRRLSYHQDQPTVHVLEQAQEVSFVTLWTPPARLLRQHIKKQLRKTQTPILSIVNLYRLVALFFLHILPRRYTTQATK